MKSGFVNNSFQSNHLIVPKQVFKKARALSIFLSLQLELRLQTLPPCAILKIWVIYVLEFVNFVLEKGRFSSNVLELSWKSAP